MTTQEKIAAALKINSLPLTDCRAHFQKIYPFTTESIAGYFPHFDLKDSSLLTVGSSADQPLNATLYGCHNITVLDICPYTKEHFYLKEAAIESLSLKEFKRFLFYRHASNSFFNNFKVLNKEDFSNIASRLSELDPESSEFWSKIIPAQRGTKTRLSLFTKDEYSGKTITRINPYLSSEENYEKLREELQELSISFQTGDILTYEPPTTYDNIFLSNIACYYSLEEMVNLVNRLLPYLNANGKILISYLYDTDLGDAYIDDWSEIYNIKKALRVFPKGTEQFDFPGVESPRSTDGVLVYQKKK